MGSLTSASMAPLHEGSIWGLARNNSAYRSRQTHVKLSKCRVTLPLIHNLLYSGDSVSVLVCSEFIMIIFVFLFLCI